MRTLRRPSSAAGAALVVALSVSACGSSASPESDESSSGGTTAQNAASLGEPDAASGAPLVFGMLNLEDGPVTFPEARAGAQAAVDYVNTYLGGINGRPMKIVNCVTDGQPSTSARCANQILDQKPVAILGAADTGAPGAFSVWERANLAYVGGIPFTPFENTYKNSVVFDAVAGGDIASAAVYAADELDAKKVSILYTDDSQGAAGAKGIIEPTLKSAGVSNVKLVPVPASAPDVSAQAAAAIGDSPDAVFVYTPNACANVLRALKTVGSSAKVLGLGLCATPPVTAAAGAAAEGYYSASPIVPFVGPGKDAALYRAAMKKYAPADTVMSDPAAIGFQTVMNTQAALDEIPADQLTTDTILKAFRTGSDHPNFLGHPYTCDGKALPKAPAVCNANQLIYQVKDGRNMPLSVTDWVTAGDHYTG